MSTQVSNAPRFTVPVEREFRMVRQAREEGRTMNQGETQTVVTGVLAVAMIVGTFAVYLTRGILPGELLVLDTTVVSFYFGTFVRPSPVQPPTDGKDKQ